ncbi:ATP-binding cassette domain-containing protein [Sphingomonas sp. F9_3S_D5_B_2]
MSLDLRAGSWAGLVGANGSGKTTLIRALAGRLPVGKGDIIVHGHQCANDRLFIATKIGLSPDVQDLPTNLSGNEYLRLCIRRSSDRSRLDELEAALDFRSFAMRALGEMSAGMKQRIAIYAAFVNGESTVFLDEPFNWLDPVCSFNTKRALRSLTQEHGYTILTALHDMATLTVHCDHGFLMSAGKIARELNRVELRAGAKDFAAFEATMIQSLLRAG